MNDNIKVERIPLTEISVDQRFGSDFYYGDFLVHPQDTPLSAEDIEIFEFWKIKEFDLQDHATALAEDSSVVTLSDSLSIMQKDVTDMMQAQTLHREICSYVTSSYDLVGKQSRFGPGEPGTTVKRLMQQVRQMGSAILRFPEFHVGDRYLETHAANSFILTIALGNAARLPQHHLMNLAIAAMFHEVGLAKYQNLIDQNRRLSPEEFELQKNHVQDSVALLKIYDFSLEVSEGIVQHHERLDGSGYPFGIDQLVISDFGRYLGLICSYVAMTTEHAFFGSRLEHEALLTLLKGAKTQYDPYLVRLLVQLLSIYPVGSYVEINNGPIGRVLRNNSKDPRHPLIQILLTKDYKLIPESAVVQTNSKVFVTQPISYKKIAPVIASLQKSAGQS